MGTQLSVSSDSDAYFTYMYIQISLRFHNGVGSSNIIRNREQQLINRDGGIEAVSSIAAPIEIYIRKTCPCNVYPLTPHFYIAKLGFAEVYLFISVMYL